MDTSVQSYRIKETIGNYMLIYLPALVIGFLVYLNRLPVVLRRHQDMPYVLCKAWAGLQGIAVGIALWFLIDAVFA